MNYTDSPQDQVAKLFMQHKGYHESVQPSEVEKIEGQNCWYYLYDLAEGKLELEVSWDEPRQEWDTFVTNFQLVS